MIPFTLNSPGNRDGVTAVPRTSQKRLPWRGSLKEQRGSACARVGRWRRSASRFRAPAAGRRQRGRAGDAGGPTPRSGTCAAGAGAGASRLVVLVLVLILVVVVIIVVIVIIVVVIVAVVVVVIV